MVYKVGVQSYKNLSGSVSFKKAEPEKKGECENKDTVIVKNPVARVATDVKIGANKLVNAFTKYPVKGLKGSKNANFYEFLTMGTVPYLMGSATMIAVFNFAAKFFDTPAAVAASKLGKKMGIGVAAYGVAKSLSKKLIEVPLNLRYGIDANLPYEKYVYELPDTDNKDNLVKKEYHKVFESVDFPRWDLLYNNKNFGEEKNAYYDKIAKKMNLGELDYSDQKVKSKIRKKMVQTKVFTTLSSYLWAATAVGISMQKPFEELIINPKTRIKDFKKYRELLKTQGSNIKKYDNFIVDFSKKFVKSCKEFVNNDNKALKYAGRGLLGAAVGMTILGNLVTLFDFNKDKGTKNIASSPLIDKTKNKVVC